MRRRYLVIIALSCLAVAPATQPADVAALINSLADRDPVVRATATQQLQKIGSAAREELQQALSDPDPEIRTRAAALLGSMSLVRSGDPPAVRKLLEQFRTADPSSRAALINDELFRQSGQAAITALKRILTDATSEDDRWAAARALRSREDANAMRQIREIDTKGRDNIPLLITVGLAWQGRDTPKAMGMLRRAVDLATARGAPVDAEVLVVFLTLTTQSIQAGQFDDAATLLRQRASLGQTEWPTTPASLELLALHANHGPLTGFATDVASIDPTELTSPIPLYCAARLLQRSRQPLLAEALVATTLHRWNKTEPEARIATGQFLVEHAWDRWAKQEFLAALDIATPEMEPDVLMRLASLAVDNNDPEAAVGYLDRVIAALPPGGQFVRVTRQGYQQIVNDMVLRNELAQQRYRAARLADDKKAMDDQLAELLQGPTIDIDLVSEMLPKLRRDGRNAEADRLFLRAYSEYKEVLDRDPDSAEFQNNLAWLCARSGERAAEAVELSTKATSIDKDNAAYLDTAAEAQFRVGNAAEAVKLEQRALALRPGDPFMRKQLARFKRGLGTK